MTQSFVLSILTQGIILVLLLSAPMLITGLIVGFIVALLQTITSIQEQTLSFVPKAFAVFLVLVLVTPWLMSTAIGYLQQLFGQIPNMVN
ncbi:Flagellar biosynthetic protein FliQ [compost metagenome]|jgi:flagellar biosynthetic protein FliQ